MVTVAEEESITRAARAKLPLPPDGHAHIEYPKQSAGYWAKAMAGQDFSGIDRINPTTFNRVLWRGLKGDEPIPVANMGSSRRERMRRVKKTN